MEEAVLLKIKRQFTHDEAIAFLQAELAKSKFKNGELLSEVAELKHTNHLQRLEIDKMGKELSKKLPKLTKEDLKEQKFIELNKKLTTQGSTIKRLREDVNLWRSKYLNLTSGRIFNYNQIQ